jgi:hypothetical protein
MCNYRVYPSVERLAPQGERDMIVAAAAEAGATILCTEDLNHGQSIEGVRVVNPFVDDVC